VISLCAQLNPLTFNQLIRLFILFFAITFAGWCIFFFVHYAGEYLRDRKKWSVSGRDFERIWSAMDPRRAPNESLGDSHRPSLSLAFPIGQWVSFPLVYELLAISIEYKVKCFLIVYD